MYEGKGYEWNVWNFKNSTDIVNLSVSNNMPWPRIYELFLDVPWMMYKEESIEYQI